jgi:hypothetical protein
MDQRTSSAYDHCIIARHDAWTRGKVPYLGLMMLSRGMTVCRSLFSISDIDYVFTKRTEVNTILGNKRLSAYYPEKEISATHSLAKR